MRVAGLISAPVNPLFEVLFETGVDEMSWDDLSKNKMPWPSVEEVHQYRKDVYKLVSNVITNLSEEQCQSVNQSSQLWALIMAFEHERIHLETSSVLMTEMSTKYLSFPSKFPQYHPAITDTAIVHDPVPGEHYPVNDYIPVESTVVQLGKSRSFPSFGWDNEYGHRTYEIPAFKASKFKISNGEFLEFVRDGGYARRELWTGALLKLCSNICCDIWLFML